MQGNGFHALSEPSQECQSTIGSVLIVLSLGFEREGQLLARLHHMGAVLWFDSLCQVVVGGCLVHALPAEIIEFTRALAVLMYFTWALVVRPPSYLWLCSGRRPARDDGHGGAGGRGLSFFSKVRSRSGHGRARSAPRRS